MESRTRGDAGLKGAFGSRASSHNKGVQRHEGLRDRRRRGIEGEGCCGIKEGAVKLRVPGDQGYQSARALKD